MKCLICIEKGYTPHGHDLLALFEMLSIRTRERLKKMWADHWEHRDRVQEFRNNLGFPFETDLLLALGTGKKAFDLIRYQHEGRNEQFAFYLVPLPDMLKNVAFELRPDWAEHTAKQWQKWKPYEASS